MSKITLQQVYRILLLIVAVFSLFLAIPTVYDYLLANRLQTLIIYVTLAYFILLFMTSLKEVTNAPVVFLWIGLFTFAYSPVVVLTTLLNGFLVYGIISFVVKDIKKEKKEQERAKKSKEERMKNKKKEPTVFDVFGQEYEYNEYED